MEVKPMKIVRVTKTEFETADGQVFEHPVPLDKAPTVKQFQKIHDRCYKGISSILEEKS